MNDMEALCKTSGESEIKAYFEAVYKLRESREEFPVDLDEVWPLVYTTRSNALRDLVKNFIQDVDYQILIKNDQNDQKSLRGRPSAEYRLSVSCLEYLIARKVRPVFEVYRQVFHKAVEAIPVECPKMRGGEIKLDMLHYLLGLGDKCDLDALNDMVVYLSKYDPVVTRAAAIAPPSLPSPELSEPDPIESGFTATWLMKKYKIQWSVPFFNGCMVDHGMMEVIGHGSGKYNRLVGEGLRFGYNDRNRYVSGGITPKYYDGRFMDLLFLLTEY